MNNGVEVVLAGVSKVALLDDVCLLVLVDKKNQRQLSVLCDQDIYNQVYFRMSGKQLDWSDSYPEVFASLLKSCDRKLEIDIYGMSQGLYQASLVDVETGVSKPIKCSHGVFMAMVTDMPIYVDKDLIDAMGTSFQEGATKASLPISVIPDNLIRKGMDEAVASEDYELASELRDELNKRKGRGRSSHKRL